MLAFDFWILVFEFVSNFEFRISDFEAKPNQGSKTENCMSRIRVFCASLTTTVLLFSMAFVITSCTSGNKNTVRLNAGGSSFIYPMMSKWASIYEKEKSTQINYQEIGSSGGISKMISREFEFGCSDADMNEEQIAKAKNEPNGGEALHIPLLHGAVVPVYNLEEIDGTLQLSGPVLGEIFKRTITKWNDPKITALNPKIAAKLPDKNIVVVRRSDGSGTTYIFSDYLCKVSPDWKDRNTVLNWHGDTIGAKGSAGVTGQVKLNAGSIGYVEMTYALQNKIKFAAVENQEKEFILGSLESTTTAAENSLKTIPDELRFSITNAPGKGAYPIGGTVWAMLYVDQSGPKGKATADFLRWVIREDGGQKYTKDLDYAPLPKGLSERAEKMLDRVKVK